MSTFENMNLQMILGRDFSVDFPADLERSCIINEAALSCFDWDNPIDVIEKIKEELEEFQQALNDGDMTRKEEEFGDLLFSIVNFGRHLNLQAESALNITVRKFIKRFQYIESRLRDQGKKLDQSDLKEMERLWQESKNKIK